MNERFKIYDERSSSVIVSAAGLREQAESLENIKVQLLRFSKIGALEAEIRSINDEVEANSRSVIDMEGTISRERTIRGNVETYLQHLVPAKISGNSVTGCLEPLTSILRNMRSTSSNCPVLLRWRTRYNVSEIKDRMYSRSPHTERNSNAAAPGVRHPFPFGDARKAGNSGDHRPSPNSQWRDGRSNEQDRGKTRSEDPRRSSRDRASPGRDRRREQPAAPGVCHDWKGQCRRGSDCRFSHHEEKPKPPRDDDGPIYPGYCRGKCTRAKRT